MDGTSLLLEARAAAKAVGLRYASDEQPGLRRKGVGKGFRYLDPAGKPVKDAKTLKRIRALAVPPAWTEVWICPFAEGHIQATGRDVKGRKQYRYHADFRAVREDGKYEHMLDFAAALPRIRETVARHMARRDLSRECVLATVVHLLETTLIRARPGGSRSTTAVSPRSCAPARSCRASNCSSISTPMASGRASPRRM
jgi:DNA topoisomerase-1